MKSFEKAQSRARSTSTAKPKADSPNAFLGVLANLDAFDRPCLASQANVVLGNLLAAVVAKDVAAVGDEDLLGLEPKPLAADVAVKPLHPRSSPRAMRNFALLTLLRMTQRLRVVMLQCSQQSSN